MSKKAKDSQEKSIVRSSAAEYLTFIAATGSGGVEAVYADESIWLSQKMMATLYDVNVRTINDHLKKIFSDSELPQEAVIRKFRITASDTPDLCDLEKMTDNHREAHEHNDEALERIYIGRSFKNDTERLEKLFDLYTKMTATPSSTTKQKREGMW